MGNLFFMPFRPVYDANGKPIAGAKLWFTLAGSNVPSPAYADAGLTTPLANPVVSNAVGHWPSVWLNENLTYRVRVYDEDAVVGVDAPLEEYDPYDPSDIVSGDGQALVVTPYDFGAVGMNIVSDPLANTTDQASLDASTDDSDALQAFFDDAFLTENAHKTYDWSGHWAISKPLYFARPIVNTGDLNVEYHGRRFRCGTLHVLPVAQQPGAVAMDTVLTISGPYSLWSGHLVIHAGDRGTANYADRRFNYGVKVMQATNAAIEKLTVISARKFALYDDSQFETWEVRSSTPFEAGSTSKNNIGLTHGSVVALNCGSTTQFGLTSGRVNSMTVTARSQGGDPGQTGTFVAGSGGYENSGEQRTRLTMASTATIEAGNYGLQRTEIPTASFTSLAANNGTRKFTFTSGNPGTLGLPVGQFFTLEDGGNVGANDGVEFEVIAQDATTVTVWPAPTTEAAKVYTAIHTRFSLHRVMDVLSGTQISVFPWVPDTANSKWYNIGGGALRVRGNDAAGIQVGYLGATWSGIGIANETLYGVNINDYVFDYCDIGAAHGINSGTATIGLTLGHGHSEASRYDFVQVPGPWGNFKYSADSSFSGNITMLDARAATTSQLQRSYEPFNADVVLYGQRYPAAEQISRFNDGTIDNTPDNSSRIMVDDVGTTPRAVTVSYDETSYRLGRRTASVYWVTYTGAAPISTMTFALDAAMTGKGWTLKGDAVTAAPPKPVAFRLSFNATDKIVTVVAVGAAQTNYLPFTKSTGFDVVRRGDDEIQLTRNSASYAQATFPIDDDFRLRIQPLQANAGLQIGIDNSDAVLVDQNTFDAYLYLLADTGYGAFVAGYGNDTGNTTAYAYAANDYFWFEKQGTVGRLYYGGADPDYADAALFWTFTMNVSGFDYVRVASPTNGAAVRLKMLPLEKPRAVVSKNATYTETVATGDRVILASGTFTINLPTAVGNSARITVKLVAAGTVTLDGAGAETIDGAATLAINTLQSARTIVSDGANWRVISGV